MNAYIIAAKRTAVAPKGGALASFQTHEMAAEVIKDCLATAQLSPDKVDEVILGNALGGGGNPARLSALAAGLPDRVAGLSIDRQCCGGLDAILIAKAMIESGQADVVFAGGVESYSRRPLRYTTSGEAPEFYDAPPFTPWPDRDPLMHDAAQSLAEKLDISQEQQNQWAISSHDKTLNSVSELASEITTLSGVDKDTYARRLSTRLCQRAPKINGTITTANTSVAADAAALCVIVSERVAKEFAGPAIRVSAGVTLGDDPELPGLAPVKAIKRTLERSGLSPADLVVAEIMEAYAVQAIACVEGAGLDMDIVNRSGGSLARGHPIGASGAILAVRLFHEMNQYKGHGIAAIAAAGGLGTALLLHS